MRCQQCQKENPPQATFCLACGSRIGPCCRVCNTELPADAKFCLRCGSAVDASVADTPLRPSSQAPADASPRAYTPRHLAEKILTSRGALEGER
jgi:rRNA maturation endonuclease Nob1